MFDTAQLLATQPLPTGGRVAVVSNSTALNLLVVDALNGEDLVVAGDPVDAGTTVSPEDLAAAVGAAGRSDDVDALVVVFVPPLAISGTAHAVALRQVVSGLGKPVVTTFLARRESSASTPSTGRTANRTSARCRATRRPSGPSPRSGRAVRYSRWRTAPPGEMVRPPGIDVQGARALGRAARRQGRARPRRRRASRSCAATASRCCRSGARTAPRRPSPWRTSSASPWQSRRPPRSGGTGSTARASG